ncbi:MAG: YajG family lipoprotein [bacterium]
MKKINSLFFLLFSAFSAISPSWAEEPIPIELKTPENFASKLCPTPVWNHLKVVWKGVQDKRPAPDIGQMTLRGEKGVAVISRQPLDSLFEQALKTLFIQCGMDLVAPEDESAYRLSAEIEEFKVGFDKKIITDKGLAKSRLHFSAERKNEKISAEVGFQIESKNFRYAVAKQIEKTAQELFLSTLEQVPLSPTLKNLK